MRVGITDHAQDALGDIVFVQLPEVGEEVGPGNPIGEVESTKSVSDIYAPVAGTVTAVNTALADAPETINADPYGEGWLVEISVAGGRGRPDRATCSTPPPTKRWSTRPDRAADGLPRQVDHYDRPGTRGVRRPAGPSTDPHPERPVDPRVDLLVP